MLLIKVDASGIDEAIKRCSSIGHVHSRNRPPRAARKELLASLLFCCERKIFEEFISGLFHGDPRRQEDTSSVDFVERGPGPLACTAYRASFLPLDWSAPSNWRGRGRKKKKKQQTRERERERERERVEGRGRPTRRNEVNGQRRATSVAITRPPVGVRNVERPRWLVRLDSSKSGIGYDKYRSWGIKSEPWISPRRA